MNCAVCKKDIDPEGGFYAHSGVPFHWRCVPPDPTLKLRIVELVNEAKKLRGIIVKHHSITELKRAYETGTCSVCEENKLHV